MVAALDAQGRAGLARALGVTRVARVTGLDRAGVEVACAVRPSGHILQVSNGKGATAGDAAAGALLEAAELWAAEHPGDVRWAARAELPGAWDPAALGSAGALAAPALWSERTRIAWMRGEDLHAGGEAWLPAQAACCPPEGIALGPSIVRWSSNGMGAHPRREDALLHALLEAIERDQLARALPRGWTPGALARRMLAPGTLDDGAGALTDDLRARGFEVHVFDLTPRRGLGLPVAGALLGDREGPVQLTAGYACALSRDAALIGALREAAQSRLTDIHGAREDAAGAHGAAPAARAEATAMLDACAAVRPARSGRDLPQLASGGDAVRAVLARLRRAGHAAAAIDLAPELPVRVVKVAVRGLRISELL